MKPENQGCPVNVPSPYSQTQAVQLTMGLGKI